ncbi:MAG: hypothetical protein ACI4D9_00380 [Lachnospiraceae bacterium]
MAKVVDITDKLSFDENPKIMIKGEQFEINADARTMLEIMGLFSTKSETEASMGAYEKMFNEKDRKKIDKLKLPFKDFMKIIEISMDLVMGEEIQGEQ